MIQNGSVEATMPLQNRVTPFGDIVALEGRGLFMGNRGVLHDDHRRVVRAWQGRRWIACRTEFRGRHRQIMRPGSYTELFFLDEVTALAAGHRPCAECRYTDYQRFRAAWAVCHPGEPASAGGIDRRLHEERVRDRGGQQTYVEQIWALPDGSYASIDGVAWLVWDRVLLAWSDRGYAERRVRPKTGGVRVLTPPSIVAVLGAGYRPAVHPTAALRDPCR